METPTLREVPERWRPGSWRELELAESLTDEAWNELYELTTDARKSILKQIAHNADARIDKLTRLASVAAVRASDVLNGRKRLSRFNPDATLFALMNAAGEHIVGYAEFEPRKGMSTLDAAYINPKTRGGIRTLRSLLKTVFDYRNSLSFEGEQSQSEWSLQVIRSAKDPLPRQLLDRMNATTVEVGDDLVQHKLPWLGIGALVEEGERSNPDDAA